MRIVFQGDSITDCGRGRGNPRELGDGYVAEAAWKLRETHPQVEWDILNCGISGNRASDLVERWQADMIDHQPDILSILIGINDTWRAFDANDPTPVSIYERYYQELLERARAETRTKIIMLEPFLLPADPSKGNDWRADLDPKIHAARRLARQYADAYIPLDGLFAEACVGMKYTPAHWSADGVHLTKTGADFVAARVCGAVSMLIR